MKKSLSVLMVLVLLLSFGFFALGSSSDKETPEKTDKGETSTETNEKVEKEPDVDNTLGDYKVTIDSCRLAKDFEGKDLVIVKYTFENVKNDESTAFMWAMEDKVYQDGVGLNESYFVDDAYDYDSGAQSKEIKKGASVEVEVAYELNDNTTTIEVEVNELISFSNKKITKTFALQ